MATYNKFEIFVENLAEGVHNFAAAGDTVNIYLSNAAPSASADSVKADLAEITNENGYTAPVDTQQDTSRSGGTLTVTAVDITITASGGTVGPFQYTAAYDDTPVSPVDPLISWWDYGSAITLNDGETFDVVFGGGALFTLA